MIVVGEAPNPSGRVLMDSPRFARRMSGLGLGGLAMVNVLSEYPGSRFPLGDARRRLEVLDAEHPVPWLVLGRRVAAAMRLRSGFLEWTEWRGRRVVVVPHPSGLNRWWNDPANERRAVEFFLGDQVFLELRTGRGMMVA